MTEQARLTMALPPGWAALDKEALVAALDEGFVTLDTSDGAFLARIRAAETHLLAYLPSPATDRPQAILTVTVVGDPINALGIEADHSDEWQVKRWEDTTLIGSAVHVSRAARTFTTPKGDGLGLVALYEIGSDSTDLGATATFLMKLNEDLIADTIEVLDGIAGTISVVPTG